MLTLLSECPKKGATWKAEEASYCVLDWPDSTESSIWVLLLWLFLRWLFKSISSILNDEEALVVAAIVFFSWLLLLFLGDEDVELDKDVDNDEEQDDVILVEKILFFVCFCLCL
jgi:hypothetical protein